MNFYFLAAMVLAFGVEATPLLAPQHLTLRLIAIVVGVGFVVALGSWSAYSTASGIAKDFDRRDRILRRYQWLRMLHSFISLFVFGVIVLHLGWNSIVRFNWGLGPWFLVDDLLVLSPYLVAEIGSMVFFYRVDHELRYQSQVRGLSTRFQWSLADYLNFQIRNQIGIWLLASVLILTLRDVVFWIVPSGEESPAIAFASMGLTSLSVMALSPVIIRWVWQAIPLPDGPLRQRLEFLCDQTGFRCSDILIWQTNRGIANAAVTGVVPQLRYVFLSDALLEQLTPDELSAVFGHEIGHIRHWHMTYYFAFLLASVALFVLASPFLIESMHPYLPDVVWEYLSVAWAYVPFEFWLLLPYFLIVFGFLSRRFERQADLYGSRTASEIIRHERGPAHEFDEDTPVETGKELSVSPEGVAVFISALDRVCDSNGATRRMWSWRHGSIDRRIEFLEKVAQQPVLADRYDRYMLVLRWVVAVFLGASIGVLAYLS